jgi:hypothetical protein
MKAYNDQFKINKRKSKRTNLKLLKVCPRGGSDARQAIAILANSKIDERDRCRQAVALGYHG